MEHIIPHHHRRWQQQFQWIRPVQDLQLVVVIVLLDCMILLAERAASIAISLNFRKSIFTDS